MYNSFISFKHEKLHKYTLNKFVEVTLNKDGDMKL